MSTTVSVYWASYKETPVLPHGIVNAGIRRATSSIYSHNEICLGHPFEAVVTCMSSSGMDHGVRAKVMQLKPENWDILPVPGMDAAQVWARFQKIEGQGYDYAGAARFALPLIFPVREHPSRWFCTEAGLYLLGLAVGDEWRFDPASGHALVQQMALPLMP